MIPVVASIEIPEGNEGLTKYAATGPPEITGCKGVMPTPTVSETGEVYDNPAGAISVTVI